MSVRSLEVGLLLPGVAAAGEYVNGARIQSRVIDLVSVDAFRAAVFVVGAHRYGVAVGADGHSITELVVFIRVGSFQVSNAMGIPRRARMRDGRSRT
jgi:hypothetical protein